LREIALRPRRGPVQPAATINQQPRGLTQELAQYFLVTCSAMVNLLTTLQSKP
jgi:hypothetical protein